MSINIHFIAKRLISFVNGQGKQDHDIQVESVDVWQTPSSVTHAIMNSADPLQAYRDWVMSISVDKQEKIYADNDLFCEGEPVGVKTVNEGREELFQFDAEITELTARGFKIEPESW